MLFVTLPGTHADMILVVQHLLTLRCVTDQHLHKLFVQVVLRCKPLDKIVKSAPFTP